MRRILTGLTIFVALMVVVVVGVVYQLKPVFDRAGGLCSNTLAMSITGSGVRLQVPSLVTLEPSQLAVAQQITNAVAGHDISTTQRVQAIRIALIIAGVESSFEENPVKNDLDSEGPFAQRRVYYGPFVSVPHAVDMLLNGTAAPSNGIHVPGLFDIPAWDTQPPGEVAANLQLPAERYRGRYAKWLPLVDQMLAGVEIDETQKVKDVSCAQTVQNGVVNLVEAVITRAMQHVGKPYIWGGQDPSVGFDCSGLVIDGLNNGAHLSVPDMTAEGLYKWGTPIPPSSAQRGDLLFPTLNHVVIYLGNNQGLEAKQSGKPIGVYPVQWQRITHAVRMPGAMTSVKTVGTAFAAWRPPLDGQLRASSPFGMRFHPISGQWKLHSGLDLVAPEGTPIYAMRDGIVLSAGYTSGYGNVVHLDYGGGIASRSAHMSRIAPGMIEGARVPIGTIIGYVGTTGSSTGNHLHLSWEVNGAFVDPAPALMNMGYRLIGRYTL